MQSQVTFLLIFLKHSFAFISHFIAEEGYSILTKMFSHKSFLVSDNKNCLFLIKQVIDSHLHLVFFAVSITLLVWKNLQ